MQHTPIDARAARTLAGTLCLALSCGDGSDSANTPTTGSSGSPPSATDGTGAPATPPQSTTAESGDSTDDGLDSSSSTGEVLHDCGLDDLLPGARNPIVAGRSRSEIPPDIAALLFDNCGCHLTDDVARDVPDYPGTAAFDMTTWEGFQAIRKFDQLPFHEISALYMKNDYMPFTPYCNLGGGAPITADDRATLLAWLGEGAPDGATWVP